MGMLELSLVFCVERVRHICCSSSVGCASDRDGVSRRARISRQCATLSCFGDSRPTVIFNFLSSLPMSNEAALSRGRRRPRLLLASQAFLLVLSSNGFVHVPTSVGKLRPRQFKQRLHERRRDSTCWASDASCIYFEARERSVFFSSMPLPLRASAKERVEVKHTVRNPVDTSQLTSFGSTFYASGYDDGNKDGWVLMQTLSGVTDDGREVIAAVAPGKFSAGSSVAIEAQHVVEKPAGLDWERAAILPFLAVNCLCPLVNAGFGRSNARGQSFVVTGGHGSLAPFLIQVLRAWGGRVSCVTTRDQRKVKEMGAELAVDFRKESYSDVVRDISVVVDTLGREKDGAQRMLEEAKGAAYVSLQPKVLKVAVEEGVLFGAGKILQYQKAIGRGDSRTYFLPNADAMELVLSVVGLISSKSVELGVVGTEYVGMNEYMEALAWPKDYDTGLRYGFPGKTSRAWGWLGGQYDEEDFPWDDDEEDEEDEEGMAGEGGKMRGVTVGGAEGPAVPTGEVVRLNSREELRALTEEGGTMVFVSSRSCRACKFLTPFYRKLARREQQVWFGRVDASSHPELAKDLGLEAVPAFVTFRGGERVKVASTSSKEKIAQLVEELLYY